MTQRPSTRSGPKDTLLQEFVWRSHATARQSGLDAITLAVLEALGAAGVHPLLLKGPAIAQQLYRPGEARAYFDIDLLVAPSDLERAGAVMRRLGYVNLSEIQGISDVGGALHSVLWTRATSELGSVTIDLHWCLEGCAAPPDRAWTVLDSRHTVIELAGRPVATLDQPSLALHLALHAAQHGPGDLKARGDLQRGLERWPREVWRAAAELSEQLAASDTLAAGLSLVPGGATLACELGLPPADAVLWQIGHRDQRPRGMFHLQAFREADGIGERSRLLRRALLPPPNWIRWEYRWAGRGQVALLAAYVAHLLRVPAWGLRAHRFRRRARRHTR